jgi:hypothetical protein
MVFYFKFLIKSTFKGYKLIPVILERILKKLTVPLEFVK